MVRIYIGTDLKLSVNIEAIGSTTMSKYDWKIEVYTNPKAEIETFSKTYDIAKGEDIYEGIVQYEDDNTYLIMVSTEKFSPGALKCKITAYIPDDDFLPERIRTEIAFADIDIELIRPI